MQDTQSISTKELRDNLSEILERVAIGGQSFRVEKFGKEKALIIPPQKQQKKKVKKIDLSKLPAFGMWKDREDMKDSAAWVRMIREKNSRRIYDTK